MMHLYVIEDDRRRVKIGISASPLERQRVLQTGNASALTLMATCEVDNASEVERHFHGILTDLGLLVRGEWFESGLATTIVVNAMMVDDLEMAVQLAMDLWCDLAPRHVAHRKRA